MWGIVPAAGRGARIQPLGFSKELLPIGSGGEDSAPRPRAVAEYLLDRMIAAGAQRFCFVIAPGKSDIVSFFGASYRGAPIIYVVQPQPVGLCDSIFRACCVIPDNARVLIGLPDTIWYPLDALSALPADRLALLLFPTEHPELFDSVACDADGRVRDVAVKSPCARSAWIWGAMGMPGATLHGLHDLWRARGGRDEYLGTLFNAYIAAGGDICGVAAGSRYIDVGTFEGYRDAFAMDEAAAAAAQPASGVS